MPWRHFRKYLIPQANKREQVLRNVTKSVDNSEAISVIGSGPSGIACAYALLKAGLRVELLDVGFNLDERSRHLLAAYNANQDIERLLQEAHTLRMQQNEHSRVQPLKSLFGSEHPYKTIEDTFVESDSKAVIRSSLACGGLSTVWGATVSTVSPTDIEGWPLQFEDFRKYYERLSEFVDVASPRGELQELFPMEIGRPPGFPLGAQGEELLHDLRRHQKRLNEDGIYIGRAKLAVGPKYSLDHKGCTPCGLCMHGCPNQAIFNAAYVLERLKHHPDFSYVPNTLLESFRENGEAVTLFVKDIVTGQRYKRECNRVFIAAGVVNSTAIVARSLNMTDHEFKIKDSQKYIFPLIRWKRCSGSTKFRDNTLAQIYMLVNNPRVSPNVVQIQYYGYNDLLLDPLRRRLSIEAATMAERLFAGLLERIMIGFVFLHSNQSGHLSLRVSEQTGRHGRMASVHGHESPTSKKVISALMRLLNEHRGSLRGIPSSLGLRTTLPGDSQHIGGTLPMSKSPELHETDLLGRPYSCQRVHVVDASILPDIPGTPLAFTVMANAMRIVDHISDKAHLRPRTGAR